MQIQIRIDDTRLMMNALRLGDEFEAVTLPTLGSCPEEEKMKRKLKFFYMNPRDKYMAT
jgi:hypothetical protein